MFHPSGFRIVLVMFHIDTLQHLTLLVEEHCLGCRSTLVYCYYVIVHLVLIELGRWSGKHVPDLYYLRIRELKKSANGKVPLIL